MKILLTGANGFVGSHILDNLCARGLATAALLRPASNKRFIQAHLPRLEVRVGSLSDPQSLDAALQDVTHVILSLIHICTMDAHKVVLHPALEQILEADAWARAEAAR